MLSAPKLIRTSDADLSSVQDEIRSSISAIVKFAPLDSVSLSGVALTTSNKAVSHGLGRRPVGWVVTDIDAHATVKRVVWDDKTITLAASAAASVNLLIW